MFHAALFTTAKIRKQPKCLSTDGICGTYIYTHSEYYSALKKKEILSSSMNLKDIILREINQIQKGKKSV